MSSLESAITLEDVFAVIAAKRVPLAAELAGYLALEIADGTDAGSGDVDPKTVFISEEGTVALVRPKKDFVVGDAEASVRFLLLRLLDASGSNTPALKQAARRKPGNGLPALVEELEAALIPVNRAAGRRALARLSREVKRVTQGVGRNAGPAPAPAKVAVATPAAARKPSVPPPPPTPPPKHDPLAPTPIAPKHKAASIPPPPVQGTPPGPPSRPPPPVRPPPPASALPVEPTPSPDPPPVPLPPPMPTPSPKTRDAIDELLSATSDPPPAREPTPDAIDALLSSFEVSGATDDKQLARDLKGMAGLSPTPPHPEVRSPADADGVEALLALADASAPALEVAPPAPPPGTPATVRRSSASRLETRDSSSRPLPVAPPSSRREGLARSSDSVDVAAAAPIAPRRRAGEPPRAPKTTMVLLVLLLVALGAATVAIYKYAPHVFVGHKPAQPTAVAPAMTAPRAPQCRLMLNITDVPAPSEVLLRVGQAPVDVDQMPTGTRLELVATAEGYAPRRAVIAPDAIWEKGTDGKPRIEIPIQLDPSHPKPGTFDPWPPSEPGSKVGGQGAAGTVHVVSNVRGAEIWLLAGRDPDAHIEQKCDGDVDVLVVGLKPPTRKRLHVGDKEISAAAPDTQGTKVVNLSAK